MWQLRTIGLAVCIHLLFGTILADVLASEGHDEGEDVCSFFRGGFGSERDELHWGR